MTTWKKYYIGDRGPFYYDADRNIEDPDGDFVGTPEQAFLSDGGGSLESLSIIGTPTNDTDVVRKQDLDQAIDDLDQAIDDLSLNVTTETKTVVTDVDFSTETVTTEDITYVTDVVLEK